MEAVYCGEGKERISCLVLLWMCYMEEVGTFTKGGVWAYETVVKLVMFFGIFACWRALEKAPLAKKIELV